MTAINSNRAIRGPVTAVPLVAGKGVRLVADTENNRIVAEADETVLWEGNGTTGTLMNLSETTKNFERIRIYGHESNRGRGCVNEINTNITYNSDTLQFAISMSDAAYAGSAWFVGFYFTYLTYSDTNATSLTVTGGDQFFSFVNTTAIQHNTSRYIIIDKIVGIHRVASA